MKRLNLSTKMKAAVGYAAVIALFLAAVWLIANEVISILENIRDIGTPLPPFLMTIAGNIKGKAEDKIK